MLDLESIPRIGPDCEPGLYTPLEGDYLIEILDEQRWVRIGDVEEYPVRNRKTIDGVMYKSKMLFPLDVFKRITKHAQLPKKNVTTKHNN